MAGDVSMTKLLLGMGLRSFSMHPAQILTVKQEVLRADTSKLRLWAEQVIEDDEPSTRIARKN
jgi:phosphotransferase system enzyme I (PtsI)